MERAWRDAPENEKQKGFVRNWANLCGALPVAIPCGSDWFSRLAGFAERNPAEVRQHLSVHGSQLKSKVNQTTYEFGQLELVSLGKLREKSAGSRGTGTLNVAEHVGDARALHADVKNANAMFQVASQFNLLEMVSPSVTPERGVAIYESDQTQGPACAIACGAGTIYRNYFIDLDGQLGQVAERQVDCLADVGEALGNAQGQLWEMRNGYALPSKSGLSTVDQQLKAMSEDELDELRAKLKIGVQWDTQVTLKGCAHLVTQAYCSALPVAYSSLAPSLWQRFARLVLDAAYEATLAAAVLNAAKTGNKNVYLTMLGGGAFGNDRDWIRDAIRRACLLFKDHALDVKLVSHRAANPTVKQLAKAIQDEIDGHARNK